MAAAKGTTGLCKVVGTGSVGESGSVGVLQHRVTGEREIIMVVRNVETSLCGNTGAVAILAINGVPVDRGNITGLKSAIQASAKPGDTVFAVVHTIPLYNEIFCKRLGELQFTLEQCDLE